ncbi:MAG: hypothetical protein M0Z29_05505 [Actinomycetota bacterium]|nr:hypothetical protein [Actinomycetota bacterium]
MQTLTRPGSTINRLEVGRRSPLMRAPATGSRPRLVRTCHVVDIENLVGQPESGERYSRSAFLTRARELSSAYRSKWVDGSDLVYVGCDASLMLEMLMDWGRYSVRFGRGADGADRALIKVVDIDAVARSCDVLQIASGDHAFADLASEARSRGLFVRVVSRSGALSGDLRRNSDGIYTFA